MTAVHGPDRSKKEIISKKVSRTVMICPGLYIIRSLNYGDTV